MPVMRFFMVWRCVFCNGSGVDGALLVFTAGVEFVISASIFSVCTGQTVPKCCFFERFNRLISLTRIYRQLPFSYSNYLVSYKEVYYGSILMGLYPTGVDFS